jgi:hypothetical protein
MKPEFQISDEDVKLMRTAGIPVPESVDELKKLLEEAEKDPERFTLEEAFKEIRLRVRQKIGTAQNA